MSVEDPIRRTRHQPARLGRRLAALAVCALGLGGGVMLAMPRAAGAEQLGALVSPGRLTRPHGHLEGIRQCQSCHESGQRVTAQKCLSCHQPVAQRIAARRGVHRAVTTDCVTCHVEHMGVDADLRPFNPATFNHSADAGYALDGKHGATPGGCAGCHKTRSFLGLSPGCASCHQDPHQGTLGPTCTSCHSVQAAFKETRASFDHGRTRYPLAGAHQRVECASCHVSQRYKGIAFAQCSACHRDPHSERFGAACASCHTPQTWRTRQVDHARTEYPLRGRHATAECVKCHPAPAMKVKPRAAACGVCHTDVHHGAFQQDCRACHDETSFAKAPFDHTTTRFALTGGHQAIGCVDCHKGVGPARTGGAASRTVDFRGLRTECVSCHADPHPDALGVDCESCHGTDTFRVKAYSHARASTFFAGEHAGRACETCHRPTRPPVAAGVRPGVHPVRFKAAAHACVSCHEDVHRGQVAQACENCHAVDLPRFAVAPTFSHAATAYPLRGRHAAVACRGCHKEETAALPTGRATGVRLKPLATTCASCHQDVHLGQLGAACETCHTEQAFAVTSYAHRNAQTPALRGFFVGRHSDAACAACHTRVTGRFPAGAGTAVRFRVATTCVTCHKDVHNGALGPNCGDCHRPDRGRDLRAHAVPTHPARTEARR